MGGNTKGWVGSLAVHLGIIVALVGFSWYASQRTGQSIEAVDPLLVDLNGIPGRKPGEIGKAEGVAQGQENGERKVVTTVKIKKFDFSAQNQNSREESVNRENSKSTKKNAKSSTGNRTTLSEFNQSRSSKSSGQSKVAGISGASVKLGRNYGKGDNGGQGGSATEQQIYAGEVLARFKSAWTNIVAAEGEASTGSCGVVVKVDASGNVTFASWITRPRDPKMAQLVKDACAQIGNCGLPPGRRQFYIDFPNVSLSDG
ncbi:MAG: hypothetical protein EBS00_05235 [Verrucomicrobia bacterium]|nr:hypothetical protein [Verrucomicrobiota bacterium]